MLFENEEAEIELDVGIVCVGIVDWKTEPACASLSVGKEKSIWGVAMLSLAVAKEDTVLGIDMDMSGILVVANENAGN